MKSKHGKFSSRNGPQIIPLDCIDDNYDYDENGTIVTTNMMDNDNDDDDDDIENDEIDSLLKETRGDHVTAINGKNRTMNSNYWDTANATSVTTTTTSPTMSRNFHFRQRLSTAVKHAFGKDDTTTATSSSSSSSSSLTRIRGFIRSNIGISSTTRNFKILAALAVLCSMTIIYILNTRIIKYNKGIQETDSRLSPHTPSLGGTKNSNHYVQKPKNNKNDYENDDRWYIKAKSSMVDTASNTDDTIVPLTKSNIGISTVRSISKQNVENQPGHYIHDPIKNPYTSPYYAMWKYSNSTTLQEQEQAQYESKMKRYSEKYGQWKSPNYPSTLVIPNFTAATTTTTTTSQNSIMNLDLPTSQFPPAAWQSNQEYVQTFLTEAKSLVSRVKEGIYEEYGYGILGVSSTLKRDKLTKERLELFRVYVADRIDVNDHGAALDKQNIEEEGKEEKGDQTIPAIAYLNSAAWKALIRKLLHGMMTHDVFYAVLIGHTNTYLGNNFQQSSIMEFNMIMEPIFDKLGMTLISRNMGMNATTTNSALGGSDIYGEADILWHVPDPRSPSEKQDTRNNQNIIVESSLMVDFLFRQAVLSGSRVPIILSPSNKLFSDAMNQKVWMGNIQPGASFCEDTYMRNNKVMVPLNTACRFVKCRGDPKMCDQHNSVCWVDRSDRNVYQTQDKNVGHQQEGYPSVQQQRLEGRKLSMLILHALDEALDLWITQAKTNILPLPDSMWHIGKQYSDVREYVRSTKSGYCGTFLKKIHPRICHLAMHAYTEWTPRVDPIQSRLKVLLPEDILVADRQTSQLDVYSEVALLPPQWKFSDNDTDVHMVAIAADTSALPTGKGNDKVQVDCNAAPKIFSDEDDDVTLAHLDDGMADDDGANREDNDLGFEDAATHSDDGNGRKARKLGSGNRNYRSMLASSDISPTFWTVYNAPIGFCDGSAQSTCNRHGTNKCLLSNYNHYRAGLIAHGKSGKIKLSLPNVREGIILAKFDWQEENGPRVRNYAPDFVFDYTVNNVQKTMNRVQFMKAGIDLTQDLRIHILMLDNEFKPNDPDGQSVTVEMEVRSPKAGLSPLLLLTHIYYA